MILDLITAGIAESSFEQFYNPDGSEVPDVTQITADGTGLYNYAGFTGICSSVEGNVYDGLPGHAPCIATVFVSENPGMEEEACGDSAMSELIGQTFTVSGISYVIQNCGIYGE